jgi:hypothetical protein
VREHVLAVGVADAEDAAERLARRVEDLHPLVDRHKAAAVGLDADRLEAEAGVSTTSLVLKSVSSMTTGLTPGTPGVTLVASTFVWKSIGRVLISRRCASLAISLSKPGMMFGIASMKVTSEPSAV